MDCKLLNLKEHKMKENVEFSSLVFRFNIHNFLVINSYIIRPQILNCKKKIVKIILFGGDGND